MHASDGALDDAMPGRLVPNVERRAWTGRTQNALKLKLKLLAERRTLIRPVCRLQSEVTRYIVIKACSLGVATCEEMLSLLPTPSHPFMQHIDVPLGLPEMG